MFNLVLLLVGSIVAVGVVEEVAVPTAKAVVEYTIDTVEMVKEKVTGE